MGTNGEESGYVSQNLLRRSVEKWTLHILFIIIELETRSEGAHVDEIIASAKMRNASKRERLLACVSAFINCNSNAIGSMAKHWHGPAVELILDPNLLLRTVNKSQNSSHDNATGAIGCGANLKTSTRMTAPHSRFGKLFIWTVLCTHLAACWYAWSARGKLCSISIRDSHTRNALPSADSVIRIADSAINVVAHSDGIIFTFGASHITRRTQPKWIVFINDMQPSRRYECQRQKSYK